MPRKTKKGLEYFPVDIAFTSDKKVRVILHRCGPAAMAVIIEILTTVYSDKGYYMDWDADACFVIAEKYHLDEEMVENVVDAGLDSGLFDRGKFDQYSILTSKGIQDRFRYITGRRKDSEMNCYYSITVDNNGLNVDNNGLNVDNNAISADETRDEVYQGTQSKVKESKVKESKDKRDTDVSLAPSANALATVDDSSQETRISKSIKFRIPLVSPKDDPKDHPVTEDDIARYQELFPAVDVEQQLRSMIAWCDSNPTKRKTPSGVKRFITGWLSREQDRGGSRASPHGSGSQAGTFTNTLIAIAQREARNGQS